MLINFSKMHGCGTDFMVIDAVTQKFFMSENKIKSLADRRFGVGFDHLLVVEPPYDPEMDFHYRIYNSDGTESSVTLPEIAVAVGTNTLTVGTEVQPSRVELMGRIKEAQINGSGNT